MLRRSKRDVLPELPQKIVSEMNLNERDEASRRFREDKDVMIMLASTMAAGVGLTWTEARYVYQLDLWWNPQVLRRPRIECIELARQGWS